MSYLDDLRSCKYTSPSGATFDLPFESVERQGAKKLAVNEPPQQDRAEVIDLGNSGIRLPFIFAISGQNYHTVADAFYLALSERYTADAPATLSHPRWGDILVCPTTWTQVESFVDGMGQAVFTVEFIRVDRMAKFPDSGSDAGGQLKADIEAADASAQAAYTAKGTPTEPADIAKVTANTANVFQTIGNDLSKMAAYASDLGAQFQADIASALASVDDLVAAPAELAASVMSLAQAPALAVLSISDKVRQYQSMVESMANVVAGSYAEAELVFLSLCGGACGAASSTLEGTLRTRSNAVDAADKLDEILAAIIAKIEATQAEIDGWLPDADTVSLITNLMSASRARMLEISFNLQTERRVNLAASVDPNTCIYDLYGRWSDDLLSQFIDDNKLADDEFFMIPAGREVVWYA